MRLYVIRSEAHRLISTGFVLKDADGRALAFTSIKPIVAHKPLRLLNDWHEVLAYPAVDLCTVLWVKVVVTNDGEHDASPYLEFPISTLFLRKRYVRGPFVSSSNRRFKFKKRRQFFIRTHNETLSVVAVCVSNPDRSPLRINGCDTTPTPPGFPEIVSDDLPVLWSN